MPPRDKREPLIALEKRFQCDHTARELRRRLLADGRVADYNQCTRCGHAGNAVRQRAISAPPPPFDDGLATRWRTMKHAARQAAYADLRADYRAYLDSPSWKAKRAARLILVDHTCELCGDRASEVHHLTYERVGQELDSDLQALCCICHWLVHHFGADPQPLSAVAASLGVPPAFLNDAIARGAIAAEHGALSSIEFAFAWRLRDAARRRAASSLNHQPH